MHQLPKHSHGHDSFVRQWWCVHSAHIIVIVAVPNAVAFANTAAAAVDDAFSKVSTHTMRCNGCVFARFVKISQHLSLIFACKKESQVIIS